MQLSQALSESCIEIHMLSFTIIIFTCLQQWPRNSVAFVCSEFFHMPQWERKKFPSHKKDKSVLRIAQKRGIHHISLSLPLLLVSNHLFHEADVTPIWYLTIGNGIWYFVNHFATQLPTDCYCKHTFLQTNEAFYRNPMLHHLSIL